MRRWVSRSDCDATPTGDVDEVEASMRRLPVVCLGGDRPVWELAAVEGCGSCSDVAAARVPLDPGCCFGGCRSGQRKELPAMRKSLKLGLLALPVALGLTAGVVVAVNAPAMSAHTHHQATAADRFVPVAATNDLDAARRATEGFQDINVAKSSGYPNAASGCVSAPDGNGAMGVHFANSSLIGDGGQLDVTKPELLVYMPQEDGSLRLVALEYLVRGADRPATGPAPVLFGRELRWDPALNAWEIHAWIWRSNPSGTFADFNPKVTCRFAT
jgi:hypothetical protein